MRNRRAALAPLLLLFGAGCARTTAPPAAAEATDPALLAWLRANAGSGTAERDAETRYSLAMTDLNGDGRSEALVYISGEHRCGSGGCNLIVLTRHEGGWRALASTTVTWPPIRVLETRTGGWRDIGVFVAGGGISPGYEALLQFDGAHYPANPTVPPARRAPDGAPEETLIPRGARGVPLFP